jgi:small redox-active disulfide protein 2
MIIKIVGAGCPSCKQLEADVRQWLTRHGVEAQVERIDDLVEILNYRLLALPGLIINERIVMMGYHRRQLDKILREACGRAV